LQNDHSSFNTLAFRIGFEYRNSDLQVKQQYVATFCAILMTIGPLTQEITLGVSVTFWDKTAKVDISYKILQQVLD